LWLTELPWKRRALLQDGVRLGSGAIRVMKPDAFEAKGSEEETAAEEFFTCIQWHTKHPFMKKKQQVS
jgi:hypothetical protein